MMQRLAWILALPLALTCVVEARAQGAFYYYDSAGTVPYPQVGFAYLGRRLAIAGFLGGASYSRYAAGGVYFFGPSGAPPLLYGPAAPPPAVLLPPPPPAVMGRFGPRLTPRRPSLEDEIRGIDLDAVPATKPSLNEGPEVVVRPRPLDVPEKDVVKPVPPVQPPEQPPAKEKPPPEKVVPKKAPGPPEDNPKDESARLINLGLVAFGAQAYGLAARRFRQAAQVDPNGARPYFLLAQAQFALGKYHEAVEAIHAGMQLHKNWPRAPFQPRLDLYAGIEPDFAEHLKRLEGALKDDPNNPELVFLLAYELWFDGRRNEAVARFQQARPLAPDPSFINQFLAAAK
jgi:hypothetical protein